MEEEDLEVLDNMVEAVEEEDMEVMVEEVIHILLRNALAVEAVVDLEVLVEMYII